MNANTRIIKHIYWDDLPESEKQIKPVNTRTPASGYGKRIPTDRMIKLGGKWRRVYCCIYSNAGTCYIEQGANWLVIN